MGQSHSSRQSAVRTKLALGARGVLLCSSRFPLVRVFLPEHPEAAAPYARISACALARRSAYSGNSSARLSTCPRIFPSTAASVR
jgi:hypothetical protein